MAARTAHSTSTINTVTSRVDRRRPRILVSSRATATFPPPLGLLRHLSAPERARTSRDHSFEAVGGAVGSPGRPRRFAMALARVVQFDDVDSARMAEMRQEMEGGERP